VAVIRRRNIGINMNIKIQTFCVLEDFGLIMLRLLNLQYQKQLVGIVHYITIITYKLRVIFLTTHNIFL